MPTWLVPPDQHLPLTVQNKIAETVVTDLLTRVDPPRAFYKPLISVCAIGWWTSPDIAGWTGYADHKDVASPTLGVTMVAAGRDAISDAHPAHLGVDRHTWAEVLLHEAAHMIELLRAGSPANGRALLAQFPDEQTRPSFLRAADDISRAVFGYSLTPGIDVSHWPRRQAGAWSLILRIADAVAPYLAPPARWTRDAAGQWHLDMTLNGKPVIRAEDIPHALTDLRRTA